MDVEVIPSARGNPLFRAGGFVYEAQNKNNKKTQNSTVGASAGNWKVAAPDLPRLADKCTPRWG